VKDVTVNPGMLADLISSEREGGKKYREAYAQLLQSLPKSSGVDAYVIVMPASAQPDGPFAARRVFGPFVARHPADFSSRFLFGAFYSIAVYDGTTGEPIGEGDNIYSPIVRMEECSSEMWADKEEALTSEQRNRIRQEIFSLVTRTIPFALADAHLISFDAAKPLTAQLALPAEPSCHES
jgi:hypothetical protein